MELVVLDDAGAIAKRAADIVEPHVRRGATLGLATGSTPVRTYQELIQRHRIQGLSFAECRAFLLDEYAGLAVDHEQSYRETIRREFTRHIDMADHLVHGPDGSAAELKEAADAYEQLISASGGIDIQILGVGSNGHIGFNEPGSSLDSRTRVTTLHEQTVKDNARFFGSAQGVPAHAITQGLATIAEAREVVLLAKGAEKAPAVAALVEGPRAPECPASMLQTHDRVTVICDKAAAAHIKSRRGDQGQATSRSAQQ